MTAVVDAIVGSIAAVVGSIAPGLGSIPAGVGSVAAAPLQLGRLTTADLVLLASDYVTVLLGLVIAYFAFLGYRRNDSRAMLFVAVGFVFVFGGPGLVSLVYLFTPFANEYVVSGLTQASELVGMLSILYGIAGVGWRARRRRSD